MTETKKRKVHRAEFKAKVDLQASSGLQTIKQIAIQVRHWKSEIQQQAKTLFEGKRGPKAAVAVSEHESPELLMSRWAT